MARGLLDRSPEFTMRTSPIQGFSPFQNAAQGASASYTVRPGDTLSQIAENKGLSLAELVAANPQITNPDRIFPGQVIQLPQAKGAAPSTQAAIQDLASGLSEALKQGLSEATANAEKPALRDPKQPGFINGGLRFLDQMEQMIQKMEAQAEKRTGAAPKPEKAPEASQTQVPGGPSMRRGAEGARVQALQSRLGELGFPLEADGIYGPKTEAAVRQFQRQNGLVADGIAGPQTLGALNGEAVKGLAPATPGAAPADLGAVAAKYESGGRGVDSVSSGAGDPGGVSYGTHQMSTNRGTMQRFLASPEGAPYRDRLKGLTPGTQRFTQVYKQIAKEDRAGFTKAQHDFITRTYYNVARDRVAHMGLDLTDRGIQEALFSTSVQHGPHNTLFQRVQESGVNMADSKAVLQKLYEIRGDRIRRNPELTPKTKRAVLNRYQNELRDVLALVNTHRN